jgi:F0F1-type ATP synthase assembly protein I
MLHHRLLLDFNYGFTACRLKQVIQLQQRRYSFAIMEQLQILLRHVSMIIALQVIRCEILDLRREESGNAYGIVVFKMEEK